MEKVLVVFWSGTGNTEIMAEKISEGLKNGGAEVDLRQVADVDPSEISDFSKIAFGCPSMGEEILEEEAFEPFFQDVEGDLSGKKVALFGSYGWGDGQWMRNWKERTTDSGASLFDTLIVNETPQSEDEDKCFEFGEKFAKF